MLLEPSDRVIVECPARSSSWPNSRRRLWSCSLRQEASDRLDERGRGGLGLDQVLEDAERLAAFDELQLAVVAEYDHGQVGPARHAAQPLQQLEAAEVGQAEVEQEQVRRPLERGFQSALPVVGQADLIATLDELEVVHPGQGRV